MSGDVLCKIRVLRVETLKVRDFEPLKSVAQQNQPPKSCYCEKLA